MVSPIHRIDQIRLRKGLLQREISEAMGMSQSQYGKMLRGENRLQLEHLSRLYTYLNGDIDLHWIMTGEEDNTISVEITDADAPDTAPVEHTDAVRRIYLKIRETSPEIALNFHQEVKFTEACGQLLEQTAEETEGDQIKAGKLLLKIISSTD